MALKATDEAPLSVRVHRPALVHRLALCDSHLAEGLRGKLDAVERELLARTASTPEPRTARLTSHLVTAGGKRLRPLLALLGAEFGDPDRPGVVQAATVAELVHLASLHHDDVMDDATGRHGVPSVNTRWGAHLAVLAGDLLLARSARLAADLGQEVVALNAEAAGALVAGRQAELAGPPNGVDPIGHYLRVISGKTAALIEASLRIGAQQAGAPAAVARALSTYGHELGLAFQMADDLLDVKAPSKESGKEQSRDLAAGVAGLPVLLALADRSARGAELRDLLAAGPAADPAARRRALLLLRRSPALAQAEDMMRERLAAARAPLADLPDLPARQALHAICAFVVAQGRGTVPEPPVR